MSRLLYLLIIALSVTQNQAARILAVFPAPFISHQFVFRSLTQELVKRGHEVTVITTDPAFPKGETPANLTEIDLHDISYRVFQEVYAVTSSGRPDLISYVKVTLGAINKLFEKQFQLDVLQQLMKREKFDLIFAQNCVRPALIFSHIFKAPLIQISSFGPMTYEIHTVGGAWHPILFPSNINRRVYNLSMWEKLMELWSYYRLEKVSAKLEEEQNNMFKRLIGPNVPTTSELRNNVDMLFLNFHPIWGDNRPMPPNVVYLGGMDKKPKKKLPEDLQNYLDSSKNGVVFISFGSNVKLSLFPPVLLEKIFNTFSKLPYDVLWKFDGDALPGQSDNIKTSKWLPQSDLLRHPKIKVFITHGGLQSSEEAIIAGVPLIGIPMNSDQYYNVEKYVYHNIGVQLEIATLQEEHFYKTIINVIENEQYYRRNLMKLKELMYDQPMDPLERAIWWTEYVLRHGGAKHLKSPGANITWIQYFEIELLVTGLTVILVIFFAIFMLWKCLYTGVQYKYKMS